jgi:hypothetical protein
LDATSAACPFCGQVVEVIDPKGFDLETAAKMRCDCHEAMRWKALRKFQSDVDALTGDESKKIGFREKLDESVHKLIMDAAASIYDGVMMRAVIKISPADQITVEEKKDVLTATRREVREMS